VSGSEKAGFKACFFHGEIADDSNLSYFCRNFQGLL
jgi:hypothetical protein